MCARIWVRLRPICMPTVAVFWMLKNQPGGLSLPPLEATTTKSVPSLEVDQSGGTRLPGDGDPHHAGHLEDTGALFRQVGLDQVAERVKHGSDVAAMDARVLGDGAEHVALAAGLRRRPDLERLGEVKLGDRPRGEHRLHFLRGHSLLGGHTLSSSSALLVWE